MERAPKPSHISEWMAEKVTNSQMVRTQGSDYYKNRVSVLWFAPLKLWNIRPLNKIFRSTETSNNYKAIRPRLSNK